MPEFKSIGDSAALDKKYARKIVIYLESEEDISILSRQWFFDLGEKIEFRPASDDLHKTGGSSGVLSRIAEDTGNKISSFGIVDRDTLLSHRNWDMLFETDDETYRSATPFGEHVHALLRWEIENYLFDPEIIEEYIADHEKGRKLKKKETVIKELQDQCHKIIPHMVKSILLCENSKIESDSEHCHDKASKKKITEETVLASILKFEKNTDIIEEKFYSLLRIIDGKRLLKKMKNKYKIQNEIRFHIARKIRERDRVPGEIKDFLLSLTTP